MNWASKFPSPLTPQLVKHQGMMSTGLIENQMECGSLMCAKADQEQDTSPSPSPPSQKHLTYPSSVKDKKIIARGKSFDISHKHAATPQLPSLAKKLTSLSSFSPSPYIHGPNQTISSTFEFSVSTNTNKECKIGRTDLRNKEVLQARDAPIQAQDGRCEELTLLTNKGMHESGAKDKVEARFPPLYSDSRGESIEDGQMVFEEGSGALPSS